MSSGNDSANPGAGGAIEESVVPGPGHGPRDLEQLFAGVAVAAGGTAAPSLR